MTKCITFSVVTEKELENNKMMTCSIKFINNVRFMVRSLAGSLLSLADNYGEGLHRSNCKD